MTVDSSQQHKMPRRKRWSCPAPRHVRILAPWSPTKSSKPITQTSIEATATRPARHFAAAAGWLKWSMSRCIQISRPPFRSRRRQQFPRSRRLPRQGRPHGPLAADLPLQPSRPSHQADIEVLRGFGLKRRSIFAAPRSAARRSAASRKSRCIRSRSSRPWLPRCGRCAPAARHCRSVEGMRGDARVLSQLCAAQYAPLPRLFAHLLENGAPLVIHCTAGKDRTGFACALILHALGVPED